jgi:trehalose/maltose hydrolase-like predicted phosphorylase
LSETARYWASRVEISPDGTGHISHVIGPDEYHEDVNDNAYTNVMARWNLRRAAAMSEGRVDEGERAEWLRIADAIVDNYDPETGLYEQYRGFYDLEPLIIADDYPVRPVHAELLYPRDLIHRSQIVKQADVVMLHHLVPGEVASGSLEPNLSFYEPRTSHGSSLSPAVYASLLARAGRLDEAVDLVRRSARLDLDNLTDTTEGGLHVATMGGVWQALVFGFAGLRPAGNTLTLDPRLPAQWDALELRVRFRGTRVRVRLEHGAVELETERPVRIALAGRAEPVEVNGTVRLPLG